MKKIIALLLLFICVSTGAQEHVNSNISNVHLQLVFRGNSLFRSHHDTGIDQYMPKRVRDNLINEVASLDFHSFGVGGERADVINNDFNTLVAPIVDTNRWSILLLTEDANYIGQGATAQQNIDELNGVIDKAFIAGFNQVILMVGWNVRPPYNANWTPTTRAVRQTYYGLVYAGGIDSRAIIIDGRRDAVIGGGEDIPQGTYFNDRIHMNEKGNNRVADYLITPAIREACF